MEPVGFGLSVISELQHQCQSMKDRVEKFKQGPETYQGLKMELTNMSELIAEINGALKRNPRVVSEVSSPWFSKRLEKIQQCLQSTEPTMQQLSNVVNPEGTAAQPKRKKLKAVYQRLARAKTYASEMAAVEEKLRNASHDLHRLASELSILISMGDLGSNTASTCAEPKYTPEGSTPALPHTVSLNFNVKDAEGKPATPEAFLKHHVLADATEVIAAAGVMNPAYGVVGMAGVGKTVALQGLAFDEDVQKHFVDGIHYMSLGKGATVHTVISEIANIMRITGAGEIVNSVEKSSSVREAVNKAETWFRGRTCLFLVDDLWPTSENTGYLHDLRQLLRRSPASRLVITTRSTAIAEKAGSIVDFGARDPTGAVSERIFLSYAKPCLAGNTVTQFEGEVKSKICKVLLLCGGLPIALSVAGCAVAKLARLQKSFGTACDQYEIQLNKTKASLREEPGFIGTSLNAGILLSLQCLEPEYEKWKEDYGVDTKHAIKDLFVSLCVLRNQGWVPLSVLSRLWKLDESEAMKVVNLFCGMSLATLQCRERKVDGPTASESESGLMLHDLHLDFCQHHARRSNKLAFWHAELLDGYWEDGDNPGLSVLMDSGEAEEKTLLHLSARSWWSDSVANDGYIYDNLARHLMCADRSVELGTLLLDARWTYLRMRFGGIIALQGDFESFGCFRGTSPGERKGYLFSKELYESFVLLFRALQLSWGRISGGRRELQFQMYGRLFKLRKSHPVLNKYLDSVLMHTEKPYLMPVTGFFPDPRSAQLMDIPICGRCDTVCYSPCGHYISAGDCSAVLVLDALSGSILRRLEGHSQRVTSVVFAPGSRKIVSASRDCTIMLWMWEGCESLPDILKGHKGPVTCVAVSNDGERIFSGSADGTLRIWNASTGTACGEYRQMSSVSSLALSADNQKIAIGLKDGSLRALDSCTAAVVFENRKSDKFGVESVAFCPSGLYLTSGSFINIHLWSTETWTSTGELKMRSVNSVAFSPNGKQLVAGSYEGSIGLWSVETGVALGTSPNVHSSVNSVAFSCDGKRIISGSSDGRLRIWDSQLSEHNVEPPDGHSRTVRDVAISRDGMRVASASSDKLVRIWDSQTGVQIGKPLGGHKRSVHCVSFSPDGRRLVSGDADGVLRLWDLNTFSLIGNPMKGHSKYALCVQFSFDGLRIVSGSWDQTVRVWSTVSQMPIGDPHRGYQHVVRHVAESSDGRHIVSRNDLLRTYIRNRIDGKMVWTSEESDKLAEKESGDEKMPSMKSDDSEFENEISDMEAARIIRSCSYVTSHLWPKSLPRECDEVHGSGVRVYCNVAGKTILLGSMLGGGFDVNWRYNKKKRVYAVGLPSGAVAICNAVLD